MSEYKTNIEFEGPKTQSDYNGPNIHDLDPYDALIRNLGKIHEKEVEEKTVRKLPESIKIKDSKVIEFTLNSTDPYHTGEELYKSRIVRLEYGLNVLVGANGSGKSTILRMLRESLDKNHYEYFSFDNLLDGGSKSASKAAFYGNFSHTAKIIMGSEGEGIMTNFANVANSVGKLVQKFTTKYPNDPVFIILDSIDSGLSINNIIRLKHLFEFIHNDCENTIIITSCNDYELARDSYCWDVKNSKPISFETYYDYHKFIYDQDEDLLNGEFDG